MKLESLNLSDVDDGIITSAKKITKQMLDREYLHKFIFIGMNIIMGMDGKLSCLANIVNRSAYKIKHVNYKARVDCEYLYSYEIRSMSGGGSDRKSGGKGRQSATFFFKIFTMLLTFVLII